jgi:hypothetical protein
MPSADRNCGELVSMLVGSSGSAIRCRGGQRGIPARPGSPPWAAAIASVVVHRVFS